METILLDGDTGNRVKEKTVCPVCLAINVCRETCYNCGKTL